MFRMWGRLTRDGFVDYIEWIDDPITTVHAIVAPTKPQVVPANKKYKHNKILQFAEDIRPKEIKNAKPSYS